MILYSNAICRILKEIVKMEAVAVYRLTVLRKQKIMNTVMLTGISPTVIYQIFLDLFDNLAAA